MPNGNGWHTGDRCLHRPSGQRGIVAGWKGDQLWIYWGINNARPERSWVNDEDCIWEPSPMQVLDKKGTVVVEMEQEIVLPPEPATKGGCDLSKYPLL